MTLAIRKGRSGATASTVGRTVGSQGHTFPSSHLLFLVLFTGAAALHAYHLDHAFIAPWDESIHAVVAEHLALHPLHPTLYEVAAVPPADPADWTAMHTWLHIPPFGLWAAALSMRLLGATALALRLPGLLFVLLGMLATYTLGRRLYGSLAGLLGAAIVGYSPYALMLSQGYVFGDATDTPLLALTPLAMLALVLGCQSGRLHWFALSGGFAGLCYLTKGALGLAPLGIVLALFLCQRRFAPERGWRTLIHRHLLIWGGAALLVAGPYTFYTALAFPHTAKIEAANWRSAFFGDYEHWARPRLSPHALLLRDVWRSARPPLVGERRRPRGYRVPATLTRGPVARRLGSGALPAALGGIHEVCADDHRRAPCLWPGDRAAAHAWPFYSLTKGARRCSACCSARRRPSRSCMWASCPA